MGTKWWHIAIFVAIMLVAAAALHPTQTRLGAILVGSGRAADALRYLLASYTRNPRNPRTIRALAAAQEETGSPDEARKLYEQLAQIRPQDSSFRDLARFASWTRDPALAFRAYFSWFSFRRSHGKGFNDDDGNEILETLYNLSVQTKEYRTAIEILREQRRQHPQEKVAFDNDIMVFTERTGDQPAMWNAIQEALADDPHNSFALDKIAELGPLLGHREEAQRVLEQDMETSANDKVARARLTGFFAQTKQTAAATRWYQRWVAASPDDRALRKEYLDWLLGSDQQRLAIRFLESLPAADRAAPDVQKMLLNLYEWNDVKEKLVAPYRARVEANPKDRETAKKLLWILTDLKRPSEVEALLKELLKRSPDDREYTKMLLELYASQDRTGEEIALLERMRRTKENRDPKLLKHLGELYLWKPEAGGAGASKTPLEKK